MKFREPSVFGIIKKGIPPNHLRLLEKMQNEELLKTMDATNTKSTRNQR